MDLHPLTPDRYPDLAALFGATSVTKHCYCTWFLLLDPGRREIWERGESEAVFERFADAQAAPVGVLAYRDGTPVGWVAAGPREAYPRLVKSKAWQGGDPEAWVVTCFFIHRSARRTGLTRSLLEAAVAMAAEHGAKAVEAVPRSASAPTSSGDGYVGFEQSFADCGFEVLKRPNEKRVLMRRAL
jgi:GNAT superfamily N-acetyltransferase